MSAVGSSGCAPAVAIQFQIGDEDHSPAALGALVLLIPRLPARPPAAYVLAIIEISGAELLAQDGLFVEDHEEMNANSDGRYGRNRDRVGVAENDPQADPSRCEAPRTSGFLRSGRSPPRPIAGAGLRARAYRGPSIRSPTRSAVLRRIRERTEWLQASANAMRRVFQHGSPAIQAAARTTGKRKLPLRRAPRSLVTMDFRGLMRDCFEIVQRS